MISRRVVVACGVALVAVACGNARPGGYETADRVLAEVAAGAEDDGSRPAAVEEPSAPDTCEVEVREDEYGMAFEVCLPRDGSEVGAPDGDTPGPERAVSQQTDAPTDDAPSDGALALDGRRSDVMAPERLEALVASLPDGEAREVLVTLTDALAEMDAACEVSRQAWAEKLSAVTGLASSVTATVADAPELADYRSGPEARELAQSLIERVVLQTGCSDPVADPVSIGDLDSGAFAASAQLTELTALASAAIEPLFQALWGSEKSPYFYHPDELAHRLWMRDEGSIDVVVAGTSQTLLGIEPDLLGERLGLSVGSVALPGAVAEVQEFWLPEVVEAVDPAVILWGIGPLDLVSACRPDGRADEFQRLSLLQQDVYRPLPWAFDAPALDLLVGGPGSVAYSSSPTYATYLTRFPRQRGDAFEFAQVDPSQLAVSLERFRPPFERGDFCLERLEVAAKVIRDLEEDGRRVIIFGMPLAPDLAATYAEGPEALNQLIAVAGRDVFEPAGAEYVGLLGSLDQSDSWFDVVHPTRAGGAALSAELGEALDGLGL